MYLNYIDHAVKDWKELYFSQNYDRLQEIKRKYDPEGLFKRYHAGFEVEKGNMHRQEDL